MKHIAVCIAAVVAVATPALAQQNAAEARTDLAGRFLLDIAGDDEGMINRIDDEAPDESEPPALNDQAAAQARAAAPQAQLPPPQTITQSRQVLTQPRIRPNN